MKSLLQSYQDLDRSVWDYYDSINPDKLVTNPFLDGINSNNHQYFIKDYFGISGKRDVLKEFEGAISFTDNRAIHTNSVFFFGLLICENTMFKEVLFKGKYSKLDYPIFPFLWFLSILFHDYAVGIEESSENYLNSIKDISDLKKRYDIQYCLLDRNVKKSDKELFKLIPNYFQYRRYSSKKIDHGILAGIYLFDRLIKIRKKKVRKDKELNWHVSLEKYYELAATAMACHNIWTTKRGSSYESDYVKFELNGLIIPNFKEISIKNFPLLFLFGIVDTIDPIKIYMRDGHEPQEILENLEVEYREKSFTIRNKPNSKLDFKKIIKAADGFKGWLALKIISDIENTITIEF